MTRQTASASEIRDLQGVRIGGEIYYEAKEILRVAGVSRQTLWTWRKERLIPAGSRFRNRIVFSKAEVAAIAAFAAKVEPAELPDIRSQMRLPLS